MSSIRVNPDLLPDLLNALAETRRQSATATLELATGSRINEPSDDPAGAAEMVANRDQAAQADSFLRSISNVNGMLQTADSTLSSVVTALTRAINLGVEGANGTLSQADREDVASELRGIQQQLISLGNTSYQGQYIFSGTSLTQPFVTDPSSPSGVSYQGNSGTDTVQVGANDWVTVNLPGAQLFMSSSGDVFQSIAGLITALQNNAGIDAAVGSVNAAFGQVTSQRVFYGNAINHLQAEQSYLNAEKVDLSSAANTISGADPASTASQLSQAQLAVNAELAAMSKISQSSLFDYLK